MRLDRLLGECGLGTRQENKKRIRQGSVKVDGVVEKDPGMAVDPLKQKITVNGVLVEYEKYHYILLYKPAGVVCSAREKGQKVVTDLIDLPFAGDLFSVGRLDKDTEGLLLLTNDGELAHRLTSPAHHVEKEYFKRVHTTLFHKASQHLYSF